MCFSSLFLFFQMVKVTTFEVTTELTPHGLVLQKLVPKHVLPLETFEFGDFKGGNCWIPCFHPPQEKLSLATP